MIQPAVRLVSASDSLILDALQGWGILTIDLGDAITREVKTPAPDADGSLDYTAYFGDRVITIGMEIVEIADTMFNMITRLRAFTRPRVPLSLYIQLDETSPELIATIRRGPFTNPLNNLWVQNPTLQWTVPYGILESAALHQVDISPSGSGTELGRTYDRSGDRSYPASPAIGTATIVNAGNAEAYPLLRIYGPCTDPIIDNDTQGKTLAFTSLTIAAGEFLEVNLRTHTVYYQGLSSDSRYNKLSFPTSKWWTLQPGNNSIQFNPATSSVPSSLQVEYRDAYL